jgi:hypothetical protein
VTGISRLRRGMTAVVITPTQDPSFIRALAALRSRGVGVVAVVLDQTLFGPPAAGEAAEELRQHSRALRHALAEYELPTYVIGPGRPLGEVLAR